MRSRLSALAARPSTASRGQTRLLGGLAAAAVAAVLAAAPLTAAVAQENAPSQEELRALIYFMDEGDDAAVAAETQRLQAQFPGWTPPANLGAVEATPSGGEIDAVYRRIATKDLDGARMAIDTLTDAYAGWRPPIDMIELLEIGEGQREFDKAFEAADIDAASDVLRRVPMLRGCDRVNNVWRLADLHAADGDAEEALGAHRGVVEGCDDPALVTASLEKASETATPEELQELSARAAERFPGQQEAFAELEERLLAGMGAATPAAGAETAGAAAPILATPRVATPEDAPKRANRPSRMSAKSGPRALATLPATGDDRIEAVREAANRFRWTACLERSTRPGSLDVLYERSWCAMNKDRPMEALVGFKAVAASTTDATVLRDARYGSALAYLARGITNEAAIIASETDLTQNQRREVEVSILEQRAVRSYENGKYLHSVAYLDALEELSAQGIRRDLDMLRGWSLLNAGFAKRAHTEFSRLHDEIKTRDTINAMRAATSRITQ